MIAVIGGGPAGMMAAITAARMGKTVHLFEKNEKLGKKLYITGKGRCNVTNHGDMEQLFGNVMKNPKFLYSAFYTFDNIQTMEFFEELGSCLENMNLKDLSLYSFSINEPLQIDVNFLSKVNKELEMLQISGIDLNNVNSNIFNQFKNLKVNNKFIC